MFDTGNELRIRVNGQWSSPLYYTQVCDGASANAVFYEDKWSHRHDSAAFDAQYLTCKLEQYDAGYGAVFVLVVASKAGSIDGFQVAGNLGADGSGEQDQNDGGSPLRGPKGAVGYYKATYGAGGEATAADPSVNHLVFGPGADGAKVSVGATTDNDLHELTFPRGLHLMYYVLWAGNDGYHYKRDAFQAVLERLAESCVPNDYSVLESSQAATGADGGTVVLVLVLVLLVLFAAYLLVGSKLEWPVASRIARAIASFSSRVKEVATNVRSPRANTAPFTPAAGTGLAGQDSATAYQAPLPSLSPISSPPGPPA